MVEKKISKTLQKAIVDLGSADPKKMDAGIKTISDKGHPGIIKYLVDLILKTNDRVLQKKIVVLLSDIQDEDAVGIIMQYATDEKYREVRAEILNSIWNSKLDYSKFIADFVFMAVEGDLMESVECLTSIENMLGPFEEHHLLEAQLYLKDYHSNRTEESDQKNEIISDIATFIKDQNEGVDADLLLE
ncbi:HEAT repeat domain-containing protein [Crocinitomicaceae bacterium]|nr:HEAT repeat domain-containing protein [Crocinitomicaceae bacterium]